MSDGVVKRSGIGDVAILAAALVFTVTTCLADTTASKTSKAVSAKKSSASSAKSPASESGVARRLPDSALKKAQLAEKELAANKPLEAIALLNQLDKEHPNFSAVSLRLAQIYDQLNQPGPALHYYRRYVHLAGNRVREEASVRVMALEVMPTAKAEAEEFAKNLGETTAPVPTATPEVVSQIAAAREDGSLVPIHGAEELKRIATSGMPAPEPLNETPVPIILPNSRPVFSKPADSLPVSAPPAVSAPPSVSATPLDISIPVSTSSTALPPIATAKPVAPVVRAAPALTAAPVAPTVTARGKSSVYAGTTPAPVDEDALLAQSFASGQRPGAVQPAEPQQSPVPQSTAGDPPPSLSASRSGVPVTAQRPPGSVAPRSGSIAFTSPTPETKVITPRAAKFFIQKAAPGTNASIKITNGIIDSVVTFAIIPEDDGEPINAILANGESRSFQVPPGNHEVSVNVATSNYPPLNLMDVRFEYQFQGGMQYSRRLTQDSLQQMQ